MTKGQVITEALRLLTLAEKATSPEQAQVYISIADRYLAIGLGGNPGLTP